MRLEFDCEGSGEVQLAVLKAICDSTVGKSMIDLCCGEAPNTRKLGFERKTFVDIFYRDLGEESANFICQEIFKLPKMKYYDVAIAMDCIEHFSKKDGYTFLKIMDGLADKRIIFTPLGNYLIETTKTDNPDSHKSGWENEEFEEMGWATIAFQNFHPTLNIGAFFAWQCHYIYTDFLRVKQELNQYSWAK